MSEHGVIAVTGGNRGIGAAITVELARRGFAVACLSRRGGRPALAGEDPAAAARIVGQACDVTDEASVRRAFAGLLEAGHHLRGLVNNAGIHLYGPSDRFATSDFERVMATNATAVFVAAREAYPHLVAAGGGLIVNIGSFFDKLGVKQNAAYCASKAAVGAITRCLAVEWATKGVRVLDVAPGYVLTDLNREDLAAGRPLAAYLERRIPLGRPATPEPIARLVASLFSENNTFLTGETIYLDGGQGIAH
jgi:NAD(P)-dependent dehydrogenase (short-subunit alcohol dehydrogenase family)